MSPENHPETVYSSRPEPVWRHANPFRMAASLWRHRELIFHLSAREVQARYRGSYLGVLWSLITPLMMLLIYTFVFSVIFKARWGNAASEAHSSYALIMFTGMVAYSLFSESVSAASNVVRGNLTYVKRVVFPLEILPVSILGSALVNSLIGLGIVMTGLIIFHGGIAWSVIYLPLAYLPLLCLTLGFSWFVAALGVFVRDVGNFVTVALQMLFFATPILYPPSTVPEQVRPLLWLNPFSTIVEGFRRTMIWGQQPDWPAFGVVTIFSAFVMMTGYLWFMKSKGAFADVV
ncbi:MAG: ABC transporter permease [Deltaproteobacteria bacterium]|nr:ABC transporter permease [Deltaproteobacteria bacterium]